MIPRRDLAWAYGSQLLNVGSGLLLLPFALQHLSAQQVGLWYLFIALAALAQLLELGFQPTIARHVAYVYGGARSLRPEGIPEVQEAGQPMSESLLRELYSSAWVIYAALSAGAGVLLLGAGGAYLTWLPQSELSRTQVLASWSMFAAGAVVTFGSGLQAAVLQGRGQYPEANRSLALGKALTVALSVTLLELGQGLTGMAAGYFVGALFYRWQVCRIVLASERPESGVLRSRSRSHATLVRALWQSAWRLGAVQLGAFLILRSNLFLASVFFSLRDVAAYGLTLQVVSLLGTLAAMIATLLLPRMNTLQAQGRTADLQVIFSMALVSAGLFYLSGAGLVFAFGELALKSVGSNTPLLARPLLGLFLGVLFLELIHSVSATYLTTLNRVPFARAALLSGLSIVALAYMLVKSTPWGLAALVIAQGLVQLAYNNWKWPAEALRHLGLRPSDVAALGLRALAGRARTG